MKLLTTSVEFKNEFSRLINQYSNYYWATAWASSSTDVLEELLTNKSKIQKLIVGIHFFIKRIQIL